MAHRDELEEQVAVPSVDGEEPPAPLMIGVK